VIQPGALYPAGFRPTAGTPVGMRLLSKQLENLVERQRPGVAGVRLTGRHTDVDRCAVVSLSSHDAHRSRHVRDRTARACETPLLTCNHRTPLHIGDHCDDSYTGP